MKLVEVHVEFQTSEADKNVATFGITAISVNTGSKVSVGDELALVETDKTTISVEAPVDGVVKEILLTISPFEIDPKTGKTTGKIEQNYHYGQAFCTIEVS